MIETYDFRHASRTIPRAIAEEVKAARLQFDEDIKDDYDWAAEAFTIRSKSAHYTPEELARIYRKTPKEINQLLERLDMAEAYLARRNREARHF